MKRLWQQYLQYEGEMVQQFRQHSVWEWLRSATNAAFIDFLLQHSCLSLEFVKWYEFAKLGLTRKPAQEIIRTIMRDEVPRVGPTHQDNRVHDLMLMGVPRHVATNPQATEVTAQTIHTMYRVVEPFDQTELIGGGNERFIPEQKHLHNLGTLVFLRVLGERLVGETYGVVVPEIIRRFGVKTKRMRFYPAHARHDRPGKWELMGWSYRIFESHSDRFGMVITSFLRSRNDLKHANLSATLARKIRDSFLDQFLPPAPPSE